MKERKLTILLALLAALALVFAGACSDGSDDDGGSNSSNENNNPTVEDEPYETAVSGLSFTYGGDTVTTHESNNTTYLGPVTLEFDDDTNSVAMTVQYVVCTTYNSSNASTGGGASACATGEGINCVLYEGVEVTGVTYSYTASAYGADSVTVTLPADTLNTSGAVELTLTITGDGESGIASLDVGSSELSLSYTVKADGDTGSGCDLFSTDTKGVITSSASFEVDDDDSGD